MGLSLTKPMPTDIYQLLNTNECLGCNLVSSDLSYSNLTNARLSSANLKNSQLLYANLASADLRNANLENAILVGADLSDTDMTGANLTGADLSYANLSKATISLNQIRSTRFVNAIGLDYSIFETNDLTFLVEYYSSVNSYAKVFNILTILLSEKYSDKPDILMQRAISLLYLGQIELALVDISNASQLLTETNDSRASRINVILNNIQSITSQANDSPSFSGLGFKAFQGINRLSSLGQKLIPSLLPLVKTLILSI